ncbi:MAG: tetratricopeptide repeat protein [Leptolyngbya sp.]|nr:tetratricopeptide repeat protein [Candidatus Melainabacteria bacterium]
MNLSRKPTAAALILCFAMLSASSDAAGDRDGWRRYKNDGSRFEVFGDYAGAERSYTRALSLANPPDALPAERGEIIARLTSAMIAQKKFSRAEPYFKELCKLSPTLKESSKSNEDYFTSIDALSETYTDQANSFNRIPSLEHGAILLDTAFGGYHPRLARTLIFLANSYEPIGFAKESKALAEKALKAALRDKSSKGGQMSVRCYEAIGRACEDAKDWKGAASAFESALRIYTELKPNTTLTSAALTSHLANIYLKFGRTADAKRMYKKADDIFTTRIASFEKSQKKGYSDVAVDALDCAIMLTEFKQYRRAEAMCVKAMMWLQVSYGMENPGMVPAYKLHALVLKQLGRATDAKKEVAMATYLQTKFRATATPITLKN